MQSLFWPNESFPRGKQEKNFDFLTENEYVFCTTTFCSQNMLKKIFGSGARVKLFRQFLMHPTEEFYIRELTRLLDEQINSLRRELENLEKIGMLRSKERNRKKYYQINQYFPLLHELTSVVRKTDETNQEFLKKVSQLGNVDLLVLSGAFLGREDMDADLFLVGNVGKEALQEFLDKFFEGKELRFVTMTREDFLYRLTLKDKFVQALLGDRNNVILKNKLKKDTEPFFAL